MAQKMTRLWLYIKNAASGSMLYVTLVSMILVCLIIRGIDPGDREDIRIGIFSEADRSFEDRISGGLQARDYSVRSFDDKEDLKSSVLKGDIDYGFMIGREAYEAAAEDDTDRTVTFVTTPFGIYGEVVKESFAECYLAAISDLIIEDEAYRVFDTDDKDLPDRLKAKRDEYLSGELLFDVNIIKTEGSGSEETAGDERSQGGSSYILMVIALCVFLSIIAVYGRTYKGDLNAVLKCMNRAERVTETVLIMLGAAIPVAVTGLIIAAFMTGTEDLLKIILRTVILTIYCIVFTLIAGCIIKREDTYIAMIPVFVLTQLVFGLIYINMKDILPVLSVIRYLFPVSVMV